MFNNTKPANTNIATTYASICARLRYVRQLKGWTLDEAAAKSNGKHKANVIGSYERGQRSISVRKLIELARLYDVPITEFFGIPDQNDKSQALIDLLIDRLHAQKG